MAATSLFGTLSRDALEEVCRSLADRGEDYGADVYRRGNGVQPEDRDGRPWREAFDAALHEYERATGEVWRY